MVAMRDQYCNGQEHIMCKPNSFEMDQNVRNIQMVEMTEELIQVAEDRHNFHRSNAASGSVDGIPSASAMRKMVWDEDLELVAAEHVSYANFEHDQCRSSQNIPMLVKISPLPGAHSHSRILRNSLKAS